MDPQKTNTPAISRVYKNTTDYLKNNPIVFLPFIIFALFESLFLTLIFLAPRLPFKLVLGPPIRVFWGERFLHYPANFLLLPKLNSFAKMGLAIVIGSLLSGMAIAIISDIYHKRRVKLSASFLIALKRYASLFIIVFIITVLFYYLTRLATFTLASYFISGHTRLLFFGPGTWMGPVLLFINFLIAVLIQAPFIYSIPILIIEEEKLGKAIAKSFAMFREFFALTLMLVGLPMFIYLPLFILQINTAFLIKGVFPESVLLVLFSGIVMSSLIIDPLITVSTTLFYLMKKEAN